MVNDIIFVIYSAFPEYVGGRETWINGISKKLAKRGYPISIYSLKPSKLNKSYYRLENYKNIRIFRVPTILSTPIFKWFIRRSKFRYLHFINMILFSILVSISICLRSKNSSTIVLQKLGFEALAGCLLRSDRRKIVALTHGDLMYEMKEQFPHPVAVFLNKIAERYTAKRMDKIVFTHNDEMRKYLSKLKIDKSRCTILYNGIDESIFKQRSLSVRINTRNSFGIKDDEKVFVNIATILEIKGHIHLIKSLTQLPFTFKSKIKVLFVGGGGVRKLLEKAKELGVDNNIMFLGEVEHDDIFEILNASDIFIMPSLLEGLPISLLEAMACGLPIIATRVGGIPEVVMSDGILVPPGDPEKLKDAIIEMMDNYEIYKHKATEAKNRILANHNWDTITDQFIEYIYRE